MRTGLIGELHGLTYELGSKLFPNLFSPGKGWLMAIIWLYLGIAGITLANTFADTSRPYPVDPLIRLILGIVITYLSIGALFWKAIANGWLDKPMDKTL